MAAVETAITPIAVRNLVPTFAEIANNAEGDVTLTVPGAAVGRIPLVVFRDKFAAGITVKQNARCTAANTVVVTLRNASGGAATPASATCDVLIF